MGVGVGEAVVEGLRRGEDGEEAYIAVPGTPDAMLTGVRGWDRTFVAKSSMWWWVLSSRLSRSKSQPRYFCVVVECGLLAKL